MLDGAPEIENSISVRYDHPVHIVSLAQRPDLREAMYGDAFSVDPKFSGDGAVSKAYWGRLDEEFPEFQIMILDDDRVVAKGNSIPFSWSQSDQDLPDEGWDFVLRQGFVDRDAGAAPTVASALWVVVASDRRNTGLSAMALRGLREATAKHGLPTLYAPVRPNRKSDYPSVDMAEYVEWKSDDGLEPFDPWLRMHTRQGGRVLHVCRRSMEIVGTVAHWEESTGMKFPKSGEYEVPGALVPVIVDIENDLVEYIEPNIWVRHDV